MFQITKFTLIDRIYPIDNTYIRNSELKIYCGPDKFYGWSNFGQYHEVNNRAPWKPSLKSNTVLRHKTKMCANLV